MTEITITESNFDAEVIESELPVLLDFWAPWCGPCKMLAPILAEVAEENTGKIKLGKVNVDDCPGLAARYGIASIPTVLLFKNGRLCATSVGYRPKALFEEMIK